ncbi:MAG: hypothetical protein ISQ35_05065 [Candidatus Pelagibacter bacterium]|jgi:hypothetical protein|nr:hypothetical protein [Candidatus Pelagibacter bacterium]
MISKTDSVGVKSALEIIVSAKLQIINGKISKQEIMNVSEQKGNIIKGKLIKPSLTDLKKIITVKK